MNEKFVRPGSVQGVCFYKLNRGPVESEFYYYVYSLLTMLMKNGLAFGFLDTFLRDYYSQIKKSHLDMVFVRVRLDESVSQVGLDELNSLIEKFLAEPEFRKETINHFKKEILPLVSEEPDPFTTILILGPLNKTKVSS